MAALTKLVLIAHHGNESDFLSRVEADEIDLTRVRVILERFPNLFSRLSPRYTRLLVCLVFEASTHLNVFVDLLVVGDLDQGHDLDDLALACNLSYVVLSFLLYFVLHRH